MRARRVKGRGMRSAFALDMPWPIGDWHIKIRPSEDYETLDEESKRIDWALKYLPVPKRALAFRSLGAGFLLTRTIEGVPAHKLIDILEPETIIRCLSGAIKVIQGVPLEGAPFKAPPWTKKSTSIALIENIDVLVGHGKRLHPDFEGMTRAELKEVIERGSDDDQSTLVHGDLCMPNLVYCEDGTLAGFIDLGSLHVGHSSVDLSVLSWTVEANMGSGWAQRLLELHDTSTTNSDIQRNRLAYDLSLSFPDAWSWITKPELIEQREKLSALLGSMAIEDPK